MGQKQSSGCLTAIIVLAVVAGFGILGLVGLFYMRVGKVQKMEHAIAAEEHFSMVEDGEEKGLIVFPRNAIPHFPAHKAGEELSREQFVAFRIDDRSTALARQSFQESVQNTTVEWLLRTGDIKDENGIMHGEFSLPYQLRDKHSRQGSSVNITVDFSGESRDRLLSIRRGDWVVVQGKLSVDQHHAAIREARIIDDSTPPQAERP